MDDAAQQAPLMEEEPTHGTADEILVLPPADAFAFDETDLG